jgi:hypothetical protein
MASGKTIEELEALCVELDLKVRKVKETLKVISKVLNQEIKKIG